MANEDLRLPTTAEEQQSLMGPQTPHPLSKQIGVALLSMVAIHFGSYAIKNAAAKLIANNLSNVAFTARRTTSISEDIFNVGRKLDAFGERKIAEIIPDQTSLGKEFTLRAQARAAQQLKRFPAEFIPAALVTSYTKPASENQGSTWGLKNIGETVAMYAAADIVLGAAWKPLMKTQAADIATRNMRRQGPVASRFIQEQLNKAAIHGSSGAAALGQMYRGFTQLPSTEQILTPRTIKKLWKTHGAEIYDKNVALMKLGVHEDSAEWVTNQVFALNRGNTARDSAYINDWMRNLMNDPAHNITPEQAKTIVNAVSVGQDYRAGFRVTLEPPQIVAGNAKWWTRFGHTEDSIGINYKYVKERVAKVVPGIAGLDDTGLDSLFQRVTEATDRNLANGGYRVWRKPRVPGRRAAPSTQNRDLFPGGYLQEQQIRRMYPYIKERTGVVNYDVTNRFGLRRVSWEEMMTVYTHKAARDPLGAEGPAARILRELQGVDNQIAAMSRGGREGKFYKSWAKLAVDKNVYTSVTGRAVNSEDEIISFALARTKAYSGLGKLAAYTKIPILNFNPLQLFQYQARAEVPEMRWVPTSSYHGPGMGVTTTPTLQMGERIYQWQGRTLGEARAGRVTGSLIRRPERYTTYATAANTITGRLVRNMMGLGEDQYDRYSNRRERWLYRNTFTRRIANALNISPYTKDSIGATARSWAIGAPMWAAAKRARANHPGLARWFESMVPESYFPKELQALVNNQINNPEDIRRILASVAGELHPGIPLSAARDASTWLPNQYAQAPFYRIAQNRTTGARATVQTGAFSQTYIKDTVDERRRLIDILTDLEDDAKAQRSRGNQATWDLYTQTLSKVKSDIIGGGKLYPQTGGVLSNWGNLEYSVRDKTKRQIISYILARPTTIGSIGAGAAARTQTIMQVQELDRLVDLIEAHAGTSNRTVAAQLRGAVASMKLAAYRATSSSPQTMLSAIRGDATIMGEMQAMVENWGRFPLGKAWRSVAHDPRNARVSLNYFADKYTYVEKFGSAAGRSPAAAIQGILGNGGIKTGISLGALHVVNRLRPAMRMLGMDFTEGRYTSAGEMLVGGYMLRRALPIMAAIGTYQWADWQASKHTGTGLTEAAFQAGVVEPSKLTARVSDVLGLREAFQWFGKVTGEEDRANILKYATMTGDQLGEFWERGEVPVRRGRWWLLSPTPFEGQRTQFFIPNLSRRIKSRYKYTWEGGRGPEEFYFSHSWLPNPSYPLAPLTRLLDPYAFEKETYQTRPYLLTGQFFNGPYGPLSPLLNATIGEFIKPTRRMHPEGWAALQGGFTPYGAPIEGVIWPTPGFSGAGGGGGGGIGNGFLGTGAQMTHAMLASANSGVVGQAMTQGTSINQPYGIGMNATMMLMGSAGISMNAVTAATPPGIWTQTRAMGDIREAMYRTQEMAGIYGFSVQAVRERLGMAPEYQQLSYIPKASEAYGFQSQFWNMQLGGMGDFTLPGVSGAMSNVQFSEIFRRFVPMPTKSKRVNPIPNQVWRENPWLPGPYSGYFEDFSVGDIYNRPYGAAILPGEAYNRLYETAPGPMGYSKLDQFRMLSKVAPWSREYKQINRSLSRTDMTPEERQEYMNIRQQVEAINQKYQFAPYRFRGMELEERSYEIMGVTDEGYLTARGARTPIKLAGLEPSSELAQELRSRIVPGQRINLQLDINRPRYSMEESNAVLEAVIPGLNRDLIGEGYQEEIGGSPLSYFARTNRVEQAIGSLWERATHTWNPFTTKFIQRRTALEQYERSDVYGKAYAPWSHPISSFVTPFFQSVGARPLWSSMAIGASFGAMAGRGPARPFTAIAGAALMGLNKVRTMAQSAITGEAYVPHRTQERWEQEEYMDILQYVGAARNYSLLRRRAIVAGEQDPESLWRRDQAIKAYMNEGNTNLQASVLERTVYGGISQKEYFAENPIAEQAFSWRERMGRTEYGANLTGDYLALQQAIPKERRMYFEQFLNAPKSDRKRILSLLPRLERRIYEAAWGMKVEEKPGLNEYFDNHFLPGPEAAIWNSSVDWDKIKVRMIEQAGGQPSEYGYYPQEVQEAEMYPIPVPGANMSQHGNIKNLLSQVLGGANIEGLSISVMPSSEPGFNIDMNITKDMYSAIHDMVKAGMR